MKKQRSKKITVELVPAESAKTDKLTAIIGTAASAGASIAEDCKFIERNMRVNAFVALRIGLRLSLLRDTNVYGALGKFIKAHVKGQSERTLYRYLRIATEFVADSKLADRKTQLLTNGESVAPILTAELHQLAEGKGAGVVVKKMVKWVDGRSLTQIYRDFAQEMPQATPKGGKREAQEEADDQAAWMEQAKADRLALGEFRDLKRWQYLDHDELALLAAEVADFAKEIGEFQKAAGKPAEGTSKTAAKKKGAAKS